MISRSPVSSKMGSWRAARAGLLLASTLLLGGGAALAQPSTWYADRPGPYALVAAGAGQYDYDCGSTYYSSYYYDSCATARSSAGKVALGYRFGRGLGVEGVWTDFGRARINGPLRDSLRMQALGVNVVLSLAFSAATEGLLRVGVADVRHSRSDDAGAEHDLSAGVGLALLLHLGPAVGLEVGWDAASGQGRLTGTAVASAFTVGLRLAF
jgi:hypothetical protein